MTITRNEVALRFLVEDKLSDATDALRRAGTIDSPDPYVTELARTAVAYVSDTKEELSQTDAPSPDAIPQTLRLLAGTDTVLESIQDHLVIERNELQAADELGEARERVQQAMGLMRCIRREIEAADG